MPQTLPRQIKGAAARALSTAQYNQIVDFLNSLQSGTVLPPGTGTLTMGDRGLVLDLSQSGPSGLQDRVAFLEGQLDVAMSMIYTITHALANATIVCSGSSIVLTFPGINTQP